MDHITIVFHVIALLCILGLCILCTFIWNLFPLKNNIFLKLISPPSMVVSNYAFEYMFFCKCGVHRLGT
jgi:hypothetical protein